MSYGNENGVDLSMPVAPVNYGNGGMGFGNDNGWWILLLFLFGMNGGWGNNGGYGGGNGLYPWMNQADITTSGFQNQMLNTQLMGIQNSVTAGFGDVQNSLCSGFAGVNATVNGGFANAETAANARQMANMQTAFAGQTAMAQGFNSLASQFADCCCENRLASADLKYTIATENCADRAALSDGVRDILANQNAGIQRILDQMCNDKIDAKNEKIADLERQLTMANLAASQTAQTAAIRAGQVAEIDAMYNRLRDCPVPTMPVYGMTPIFTCPSNGNSGCGCGCGGNSGF